MNIGLPIPNPVNSQIIGRCGPKWITHRVRLQIVRTGHSNQNETISEPGNICTYNSKWDKDIRSFAHYGEDLAKSRQLVFHLHWKILNA